MAKNAILAVLILGGLLPAAQAHEGLSGGTPGAHAPSAYSRWHYWAPTLYRLRNEHRRPLRYVHPTDAYPWVPSAAVIIKYPQPAIPPGELYLHTGLPYDPARPAVPLH